MPCKYMEEKIPTYDIHLVHADTYLAQVEIHNSNGSLYTPAQGDVVTFAVKRNAINPNKARMVDAEPLISKTIPNETLILELLPSDTENLGFGNYYYDISITLANGRRFTFLRGQFIVEKEAHTTWTTTTSTSTES